MLDTNSTQISIKSDTITLDYNKTESSINSNIIISSFTGKAETTYKAKLGKSKIT